MPRRGKQAQQTGSVRNLPALPAAGARCQHRGPRGRCHGHALPGHDQCVACLLKDAGHAQQQLYDDGRRGWHDDAK